MASFGKNSVKRKGGYTLVEMLVYIAILTIVSSGALTLLFSMGDQINAGRAERVLTQSAKTTLERMLTEIRATDTVNIFASSFETSPGELVLTQGASTTDFSLSGTAIVLSKDGVSQGPLTPQRVTVDDLRFYHYDNTNTELVRIELTLTSSVGETSITRSFSAASVLRNSYD